MNKFLIVFALAASFLRVQFIKGQSVLPQNHELVFNHMSVYDTNLDTFLSSRQAYNTWIANYDNGLRLCKYFVDDNYLMFSTIKDLPKNSKVESFITIYDEFKKNDTILREGGSYAVVINVFNPFNNHWPDDSSKIIAIADEDSYNNLCFINEIGDSITFYRIKHIETTERGQRFNVISEFGELYVFGSMKGGMFTLTDEKNIVLIFHNE